MAATKVLFFRKYTKMSIEQLDTLIKDIQADSRQTQLLQILSEQLELLIREEKPDLYSVFASLESKGLVSEKECIELKASFAQEVVR